MANGKKQSKKMQEILSDKEHMDTMDKLFGPNSLGDTSSSQYAFNAFEGSYEALPKGKDPYEGFSTYFRLLKGADRSPFQHMIDSGDATQEEVDQWHLMNWLQAQDARGAGHIATDERGNVLPGGLGRPPSDREPGESMKLRRIEDKVMDGFIQQDTKYNMGE